MCLHMPLPVCAACVLARMLQQVARLMLLLAQRAHT